MICAPGSLSCTNYAHSVDDGDIDTFASIVVDDVAVTRMGRAVVGREAFLDTFRAKRDSITVVAKHIITNVQASQIGDLVRARAYFEATLSIRTRPAASLGSTPTTSAKSPARSGWSTSE